MMMNMMMIHILGGEKSKESFLQDGSCSSVAPRLAKCRECKAAKSQRGKPLPSIFCRFYGFRRRVKFSIVFLVVNFYYSMNISGICVMLCEHFSCLCDFV